MSSLELYQRAALADRINNAEDPADELINAAFDNTTPDYLRAELQELIQEGFDECFPDLKPSGCDVNGVPLYHVNDIAGALGIPPEEVREVANNLTKPDIQIGNDQVYPIH